MMPGSLYYLRRRVETMCDIKTESVAVYQDGFCEQMKKNGCICVG